MGRLEGRVAIVTGAGGGLGRAYALRLAEEGAAVVVNDLGAALDGAGRDDTPAQRVVEEIKALGGKALASGHDVTDWEQAQELVAAAVAAFGDLHVLVTNAGILRDRTLFTMDERDWDAVVAVHLKGQAAPIKHALAYWREQAKAGRTVQASTILISSVAAFAGNFGQANYTAAKSAVLGLSRVISLEAGKYGVRSNVVSPGGRTRMALAVPGNEDAIAPPPDGGFDYFAPENVAPLVAWLATADCPADSQIFQSTGSDIMVLSLPRPLHKLTSDHTWTLEELDRELAPKLVTPLEMTEFLGDTERLATEGLAR